MTDQPAQQPKGGKAKLASAFVAAALTTYFINQASLHGVDFTTLGIPSEMVKSAIEAHLIVFAAWATPQHFVDAIVDTKIWLLTSWKRIRNAEPQ